MERVFCYPSVMKRGPEGKFQDNLLTTLRSAGMTCQKFNDLYSEGIPDTLVKFSMVVLRGICAAWIELKAIDEWPKRETTKLPKDAIPTEAQARWMRNFATLSVPCWVILNTPDGWMAYDHTAIDMVASWPVSEVKKHLCTEKPTLGRILRNLYAD